MKTLLECDKGEYIVQKVYSNMREKKRLADLGIFSSVKIKKIKSGSVNSPVLVRVRGTTLALGKELANKILVKKDEEI